jgi:hypothetical protein
MFKKCSIFVKHHFWANVNRFEDIEDKKDLKAAQRIAGKGLELPGNIFGFFILKLQI